MSATARKGERFVVGMIAVSCVTAGVMALFGLPAAGGIFVAFLGMLVGMPVGALAGSAVAGALLARGDRGPRERAIKVYLAIGAILVAYLVGYRLSVLDYTTLGGLFPWGLYLGFWPVAARRLLARPRTSESTPSTHSGE